MQKLVAGVIVALSLWFASLVPAAAQGVQANCNPCTPGHVPVWVQTGILGDGGTGIFIQNQGLLATQYMQFSVGNSPIWYFDSLLHTRTMSGAPSIGSAGSSPGVIGSDSDGVITMGTGSPTGGVLTFAQSYLNAPFCVVTWQTNLASMIYTVSAAAITITQTATSSNKINYHCVGQSGG